MPSLAEESLKLLSPTGPIARLLPDYEVRKEQLAMAEAVARAVEEQKHLLVEAGTGVGKTFAYLVPLILWAVQEKKRVVVSTFTKTLQHQLIEKDLPLLHEALGQSFRYAAAFGSQNYVCLRRLQRSLQHSLLETPQEVEQLQEIRAWTEKTKTGLRSDLDFEPSGYVWSLVDREPDLCMGRNSPFYEPCFYQNARRYQQRCHVLVVNHHLFFANVAADGFLLPEFDAVVFDEAHNLEEVASNYFAAEFSNTKVQYLLSQILGRRGERGILPKLQGVRRRLLDEAGRAVQAVSAAAEDLFFQVQQRFGEQTSKRVKNSMGQRANGQGTLRISQKGFVENGVREPLVQLAVVLDRLRKEVKDEEDKAELEAIVNRVHEMTITLDAICNLSFDGYVYWAELEQGGRGQRIALCMAPIEVNALLAEQVFSKIKPCILTSATLATGGSFHFIRHRLGIDEANETLLSSPFRFDEQVVLYVPNDLPDPSGGGLDAFTKAAVERTKEILDITQGATFVLFTSFSALNYACKVLAETLPHLTFFVQGEMPRERLLDEFRKTPKAVLLGTNTFWQGVDVAGEALIAVVIVKLPFAVPDHPVIEARMERMQREGRDPFIEYQLPQAVIMLRQGFGRLIRSKSDYGLVAILDPRLHTKGYGRQFLRSLPTQQIFTALEPVREFFRKKLDATLRR